MPEILPLSTFSPLEEVSPSAVDRVMNSPPADLIANRPLLEEAVAIWRTLRARTQAAEGKPKEPKVKAEPKTKAKKAEKLAAIADIGVDEGF